MDGNPDGVVTPPPDGDPGVSVWERGAVVVLWIILLSVPLIGFSWYGTHDGLTYPVRVAEWSYLFRTEGAYPRWASSFYWGFGYPIFNYFPPLAYFLGHLLMLAGFQAPAAVKCIEILTFVLSFAGLYRLCRLSAGRRSAFAAALAGMLVPYRLVDIYVRGDVAESLAFALLPFVFAEAVLCARRNRIEDGLRLAVFLALLFFAHTLTSFMGAIALAVFGLFHLAQRRGWAFVRIGGWSGAGLALSAASWVPALLERKYVNVNVATHARDFYTFFWGDHFIEWWQRFDPAFGFGPSLPGPDDRMNFTVSFVILGALVWSVSSLRSAGGRHRYGFLLLALAAVQLMMMEISRPVWAHVPFVPFFQFPWRFLILDTVLGTVILARVLEDVAGAGERKAGWVIAGTVAAGGIAAAAWKAPWSGLSGAPAVWFAAVAAGTAGTISFRYRGNERGVLLAIWASAVPLIAGVVVHAQQTEFPAAAVWQNPSFSDPVVREQTTLRRHDGLMEPLQTTGTNEFLPLTAEPPPAESMRGIVQFEGPTEGAGYKLTGRQGTQRSWEIASPVAQAVLLPVFHFPGMLVELNGQPQDAGPGKYGLIRAGIPAGMSRVAVRYEGTMVQHLSELVSIVAAAQLAGLGILLYLRGRKASAEGQGLAGK